MSRLACRARPGNWLVVFLVLWAYGSGVLRLRSATYFVSPEGSDSNTGTELALPLQTLAQAAAILVAGDTCYLRSGIYRETLAPKHSGTSNAPITFAVYPGETAMVSGADAVSGWAPGSGGNYTAQVGWDLGNGYNQVFVDGAMVHQARYPIFGSGDLLHPATVAVTVDSQNTSVLSSAAWGGHPDNYWAGAWFCGAIDVRWSWQCARVVSSSGNSIVVDGATKSNPWFAGNGVGVLWGLLSLLDSDGEWHLQTLTPSNRLYLRVAGGGNPADHTVEMKRRFWCVDISGCNFVTVRGLQLRAGAVRLRGNGNVLENCQARYLSHYMTYTWGYAFDGDSEPGGGVVLNGTNNTVRGCTVWDTAGSGILSRGGNNSITRNLVYNTDYSGTYACGLRLEGLQDRVSFNTLRASGRDVLQPGGAGHAICYNDLSNPGQMCEDVGVIYIWGVNAQCASGPRTRIAYNWIHDHAAAGPAPLVYLDNWCRNFVVDHNVCWNGAGDAGIRVNAPASGHRLYNNTLFFCDGVGTHTYNMWPQNNPDPAFWTGNFYDYSALNNLFLGTAPQTQLWDWANHDFRLKPEAAATGSGVPIAGYTDGTVGAPDKGACDTGAALWKPGVNGWCQPALSATSLRPGTVTLRAPAGAAYFQLQSTAKPGPSAVWTPVTNPPVVSPTDWLVTVEAPANGAVFYRLQAK